MKIYRSNVADFVAPVASGVTHEAMTITGKVVWFKGAAPKGVAYKKHSATKWTYVESESADVETTISTLDAETKYDVKLYLLFGGEYQYSSAIEVTTEAAPVVTPPAETPTSDPE